MKAIRVGLDMALVSTVILALARVAQAGVMLEPVSATTDMGEHLPAVQAIDQSGLSITYTSLKTDFDTYIASGPTAYHGAGQNAWGTPEGVHSGTFTVALGGDYEVDAMAFWDLAQDPSAVRHFQLLADDDPGFSHPILLGTFSATNPGTSPLSAVEVFRFARTRAAYVRMCVLDTWESSSYGVAFNEMAFEAVPEPATLSLLALGGLLIARRRRA